MEDNAEQIRWVPLIWKSCAIYGSLAVLLLPTGALAQVSGNAAYGQVPGPARAEQEVRGMRTVTRDELPPDSASVYVDASVLANVAADEYVAVFGVTQEGATPAECNRKMGDTLARFLAALGRLGVAPHDQFVDFVAQNRVYTYDLDNQIARERLSGFELKKNVIVHYRDYSLLDRIILAAADLQIYDLVKVDYVVRDTAAIRSRLRESAARIIKQKAADYRRTLGIPMEGAAQVIADRSSVYYPAEMYDSYIAAESEDVNAGYYSGRYVIQAARKARTFYYNGLNAKDFDIVINPVVTAPEVQFTLYLKVRYSTSATPRPKPARRGVVNPGRSRHAHRPR